MHNDRWFGPYYIRKRLNKIPAMFSTFEETTSSYARLKPIFIIGSIRSGNTMLRAMLVSGGELVIPPESFVLRDVIRKFRLHGYLPWEDLVKVILAEFATERMFPDWNVSIARAYERAVAVEESQRSLAAIVDALYAEYAISACGQARRWGDKTPLNHRALHWINRVFPGAQFVHILRDGRDAVASTLDAGIYTTPEAAAQRWVEAVMACRRFGDTKGTHQFLEVRYEELVTDPNKTLARVCGFAGLRFDESMLDFHKNAGSLGDTYQAHHANVSRPVSSSSIGQWRARLTDAQVAAMMPVIEGTLSKVGYGD